MSVDPENDYKHIRNGVSGFYEQKRGLIAVWGEEAVQFLDGLVTNDVKTLADGQQKRAAFPNAQGRLLATVRVLRQDAKFLIETEEATRENLFQNLFRFSFAGDFFADDLSADYQYFEMFNADGSPAPATGIGFGSGRFTEAALAGEFRNELLSKGAVALDDGTYETLRIENGIPRYGQDMDETTIVPELGIDEMISYSKGCYIGQEIIARIHFRGHVAKRLTGLSLSSEVEAGTELKTVDGKNAGRVTSVTFSPKVESVIALGYVRYDYLTAGTELVAGDAKAVVTDLPFI